MREEEAEVAVDSGPEVDQLTTAEEAEEAEVASEEAMMATEAAIEIT